MLWHKYRFVFVVVVVAVVDLMALVKCVNGANILALLSSASQSHHIIETTILEALSNRGHNITVLSTWPMLKQTLSPNYHEIYIKTVNNDREWAAYRKKVLHNGTKTDELQLENVFTIMDMVMQRSRSVMDDANVQHLMKSNQTFDLYFLGYNVNDMMLGLAGHFRVPTVVFSTIPPMKSLRDMIGNPAAVASTPIFKDVSVQPNNDFRYRFGQFIAYTVEFFITAYVNQFMFQPFYDEYFPSSKHYPSFDEVRKNVSLILTNTHFAEGNVRPALPNLIEILGVHIKEEVEPLPQNIQNIIKTADANGIIVFSFGGNYKSADMSVEKIQIFFDVFAKLKQTIIWKWESNEIPSGKPDNVYMIKWLPQIDLLAQPQVQFFISHCGTGGVYEAKYHGVPILGMPIHGDQLAHAKHIESQGWAIILNIDYLNRTILAKSIEEMLTNPIYKQTAKKMSQLFRDRPMTPLQTAIYWIEYVIRYDGAKHMQSPAVDLNVF